MLSISLIDPQNPTEVIKTIASVNLQSQGIDRLEITDNSLNQPAIAEIEINPNFPHWQEIRDKDYGFKLTTEYNNIAFIKVDRKMNEWDHISSIFLL